MDGNMRHMHQRFLGKVGQAIVSAFSLDVNPEAPVYIGQQNIMHIQQKHYDDYLAYGGYLKTILSSPDFVGYNSKDRSLEYYKSFGEEVVYVKLAVRSTSNGVFFARTMYSIKSSTLFNRMEKGSVVKITKLSIDK